MLPTTGFFKNIDCPFYESSCERPYCHFKHRKKPQEPTEVINAVPLEVPTYNPTPKSQLANAKSHIPISYVPDLAVRTERNFRSLSSSYGYSGGDKPTYKPTPLSVLSTGKINSIKSTENINYNPTAISREEEEIITNKFDSNVDCDDLNEINFEDLETEFDMIDELINDSDVNHEVNGENKEVLKNDETTKSKHKSSSSSSRKSKHNGKEKESTSSKSKSDDKKSKPRSHSSSNKKRSSSSSSSRSESKSSNDKKESKSFKSNSKDDGKRSRSKERKKESSKSESSRDKKHESKDKHKHHKESSRHSHKSKTKERDKERKSEDKKKHKVSSKSDDKFKEKPEEKLDTNSDESNNDECDLLNFDNEDSDVEEDTLEECYKIFTEYKPTEPELFPELKKQETNLDENSVILNFNRKRIAHENADKMKSSKVLFNKPKYVPSAAQMMVNRLKAARIAHASNEQDDIMTEINKHIFKRPSETVLNDNNPKVLKTSRISTKPVVTKPVVSKPSTSSSSLIDDIISGKSTTSKPRRIAPVQNVDSIQRAKAKLQEMAKMRAINATKTVSQSIMKGVKRTAHVPEYSVADVPDVLEAERSKLPVNVRSRFLTMIIDECVKLYLSKEEAHQRALNEEYKCYERCAAIVTYRNSAMLAVNRLRKELQEREIQGLGPIFPGEVSDSSKSSTSDLHGPKFYKNIKRFILTDEELLLHGFPREGTLPGQAIIKNQKHVPKGYLGENDRSCCRCLKLYKVDEQGFAIYEEECLYHPLKKRTFRGESIYLCCRSSEDTGCVTAATHVCESIIMNDGEIEGYQTTMPPDRDDDPRSYEVFALDCEMCYTTKGLELTRVTIVNSELKTVYETLVKPLNTIIDYNTRFSGITEEQMNRTATSILQVQANILHLCNSNTILIGHSLESDMKALKIIHNTIVDTSVLFPHKFGLPHKRALRDLAREYLKKIIQNDISGHDSAEDALTCMELVQWKVKEELKTRGIKV